MKKRSPYKNPLIGYYIMLILSIISLVMSLFVFDSEWSIVSYPTLSIFGVVAGAVGITLSKRHPRITSILLVFIITLGAPLSLQLSLSSPVSTTEPYWLGIISATISLSFPIIFAAYFIHRYYLLPVTIMVISVFILVSITEPVAPASINQPPYYIAIVQNLVLQAVVLYFLRRQVDRQQHELEEALLQRNMYVDKVSHDIRTPIHGILNILDFTMQGIIPSSDVNNKLASAKASVQHISHLIDHLQLTKELITNELKLKPVPLNLHQLITGIVDVFYIPEYIDFEIEIDAAVFTIDEVAINQIIRNLVSNAIKYCEVDAMGQSYVAIKATIELELFVFEIRNRSAWKPGPIAPLTEMYKRSSYHRAIDGRGIGLSVVNELINRLNGKLDFRNVDDNIIITIRIPQLEKISVL